MKKNSQKGFSLIEILLVLVIVGSMILLLVSYTQNKTAQFRRDKTVLQMQAIISAALAYYTANGTWPVRSCRAGGRELITAQGQPAYDANTPLLAEGYLFPIVNPYNIGFNLFCLNNGSLAVTTAVTYSPRGLGDAKIIASLLPVSEIRGGNLILSTIPIPGQNLNNARSVNFGALYNNGACVPAPQCPQGMAPEILAVPVSVKGVADPTDFNKLYPIHGFTAYAWGRRNLTGGSAQPSPNPSLGGENLADCYNRYVSHPCPVGASGSIDPNTSYWRVCLDVYTSQGRTSERQTMDVQSWGQNVSILAMTRCVPANEPTGSGIGVWGH